MLYYLCMNIFIRILVIINVGIIIPLLSMYLAIFLYPSPREVIDQLGSKAFSTPLFLLFLIVALIVLFFYNKLNLNAILVLTIVICIFLYAFHKYEPLVESRDNADKYMHQGEGYVFHPKTTLKGVKDKNKRGNVTFNDESIDVDVSSFEVLDEHSFARDVKFLYYKGNIMPDVDPHSFAFIDKNKFYAKVGNTIYYNYLHIFADHKDLGKEFKIGGVDFLSKRSDRHILEPIVGADVPTFKVLSKDFAKDSKHVYVEGFSKDNLKVDGFDIIKPLIDMGTSSIAFVKNDNKIYKYQNSNYKKGVRQMDFIDIASIFEEVDEKTFELVTDGFVAYVKDKNSVYVQVGSSWKKIKDADPKTFMLLKVFKADTSESDQEYTPLSKDKSNIFYLDQVLPNADDSIHIMYEGYSYFASKNNVFFLEGDTISVLNINPKTVEILKIKDSGNFLLKDGNNFYYKGEKVMDTERVKALKNGDEY